MIERLTITLPGEMAALLRENVAGGQYATISEIVREALREWSRRRNDELRDLDMLRAAIKVGDDSGNSVPAAEVFAELRAMIGERRAAQS